MAFIATHYDRAYAPNTRETFRRQVLHQFVQGKLVDQNPDDPNLPTNRPRAHYAITPDALAVVQSIGTDQWMSTITDFREKHGALNIQYRSLRRTEGIAATFPDGMQVIFSPGKHNRLQALIIEQFVPLFAPKATVLYIGDTADKDLFIARDQLAILNIPVTENDKLPDILLFDDARQRLFLIEAVTSHGPMSPKRIMELTAMLQRCSISKIFVTAFLTFTEFRKQLKNIAWETEVWIAEVPDHLIHFDGDRFLHPR
jgi:hypothetical protein